MFKHLKTQKIPKRNGQGYIFVSKVLTDNGITFFFVKFDINGFKRYRIKARVNLSKILNPDRKVSIYHLEDYHELWEAFKKVTDREIPKEYEYITDLDKWNTRRIDYCFQTYSTDTETYIDLFQRGNKPSRIPCIIPYKPEAAFKNHIRIDDELRKSHKTGSVYFMGGKFKPVEDSKTEKRLHLGSVIINIYDKYNEMRAEKNRGKYTTEEIEQEKGVLRFEVQCLSRKIDSIISNFNLYRTDENGNRVKDKRLRRFLRSDIAKSVILPMYEQICGTGDYYKKKDAIALINIKEDLKPKQKQKLIDLINYLNGTGSGRTIWKELFKLKLKGNREREKMRDSIKALNDLEINPITLKADYYIDELPSLYERIGNCFDSMGSVDVLTDDEIDDFLIDELEEDFE